MRGCVYLVGAGCGRADLITLRGLRLLQCCDVVVYDDLIDRHLLEAAPQAAERLYVGKRLGRHSTPQEEISRLLVKKTLEGKVVALESTVSGFRVLGEGVHVRADEKVVDEQGRVDPTRLNAFIFDQCQSGYYKVGEKVGQAWKSGTRFMK